MTLQFSLRRLLGCVAVVAVVSSLFASLKWPVALAALAAINAAASVAFGEMKRPWITLLALVTASLIALTLIETDWGFSTSNPAPMVRVAWPWLIAACVTQVCTLLFWLFGAAKQER